MLYGYVDDNNKLEVTVGAGTNLMEYNDWVQETLNSDNKIHVDYDEIDMFNKFLYETPYHKIKENMYVFKFSSEDYKDAFVKANNIEIIASMNVIEKNITMVEENPMVAILTADVSDTRTIGEITKLDDDYDPWDLRTAEQKAQDKEGKLKMEDYKKKTHENVTGQSFDPNPNRSLTNGIAINRIYNTGDGNVGIEASKLGESVLSSMKDMIRGSSKTAAETVSEADLEVKLKKVFNDNEVLINKFKSQFDFDEEDHVKHYKNYILSKDLEQRINEAMEPIPGTPSLETVISVVTGKLHAIPELTQDDIDQLIHETTENFNAPKPKPQDFFYAYNERLTNTKAISGGTTLVFSFNTNPDGPNQGNFDLNVLDLFLPDESGFKMISGEIYCIEKMPVEDAKAILEKIGFIENDEILDCKAVIPETTYDISFEDFGKHLVGDGTSTVTATGSYGEKAIIEGVNTVLSQKEVGIKGPKGAVTPVIDVTKKRGLTKEINNVIGTDLAKIEKEVIHSLYGGVVLESSYYPFIETPDFSLVEKLCCNVKLVSGVSMGTTKNLIFKKENRNKIGVLVFETEDKVYVIEI